MLTHALRICVVWALMAVSARAAEPPPVAEPMQAQAVPLAEHLMIEISEWLSSTFDLPRIEVRPGTAFVPQRELENLRGQRQARADWGRGEAQTTAESSHARSVVAVYDFRQRTILLNEGWTGKTPADQSVLVHEMVHHIQYVAGLKFECPEAREKLAYKAQDRWLGRFGTSLEIEFGVDPMTVLVSSACM